MTMLWADRHEHEVGRKMIHLFGLCIAAYRTMLLYFRSPGDDARDVLLHLFSR